MTKLIVLPNGRSWRTQTDALNHFKAILARYSNDDTISNPTDHSDLFALLCHYDSSAADQEQTKIGVGVDYFKRQSNAEIGWSTDGFWVYRNDGTSTDFSYIKAVKSVSK
jgi:hypothetical protein